MRYGKYMRIDAEQNHSLEHSSIKRNIMDQEMELLIWEYIDDHCSPAEKTIIEKRMAVDPAWLRKFNELMNIHELLQKEELEMPSLRFTKNVMEEIAKFQVAPATKNYINKNVIRGFTAFFLVMIGGLFIYFVGQIHWTGSSTGTLIPTYTLDAGKLNWGKLLNNSYVNIFTGICAILGLILADKYMQTRKSKGHTGDGSIGDSA
jgi:hypothetical protein